MDDFILCYFLSHWFKYNPHWLIVKGPQLLLLFYNFRIGAVLAVQTSFLVDHNDNSDGTDDDVQLESSFRLRRQR
jgi:hypothetical protein